MDDVFKYLNKVFCHNKKKYVVVAISGGPDSMALLHILMNFRDKFNFKIVCAHVNHNVRSESENEKEFLKNYCNNNGIIFEYMKIHDYSQDNFHDQARKKRYDFFESILKIYNSDILFTAHHGDDLVETILMRITRGSTLKGYSGFQMETHKNNYINYKPLIFVTKKDLEIYNKENDIKYVTDLSNEKECYTRNRYRKHILPFLKQEDVNIHKKYLKFSEELLKYDMYIDSIVEKLEKESFVDNRLNLNIIKNEHILIKQKLLERILNNIYKENIKEINQININLLIELFESKSGSILSLPKNIKVLKDYDFLMFYDDNYKYDNYKMELKDKTMIDNYVIEFVEQCNDTSNYCIRLNSNDIKLPLYLRNRRVGDKMEVKGLDGSKKIKDIFINSKISRINRDNFPILVDSDDKILWLPGIKKSKYDKKQNEKYDIIVRCI